MGGPHRGIGFEFKYLGDSNLYSKWLKGMNKRVVGQVLCKKPHAKNLMSVSLIDLAKARRLSNI
jgi:hypothetical protein